MDFTGRLCGVSRDYITKKPMIQFLINEEPHGIEDYEAKDLKIKVARQANPRSLDANAYFHVLCDKLRQKLEISMAACKNMLITSYGQIEYIDDEMVEIKSNIPFEKMREEETLHLRFIRMSDDGRYLYILYRGSHTYTSHEMHKLLEGTIQDCKDMGIETKTPDEIQRLETLWAIKKGELHE